MKGFVLLLRFICATASLSVLLTDMKLQGGAQTFPPICQIDLPPPTGNTVMCAGCVCVATLSHNYFYCLSAVYSHVLMGFSRSTTGLEIIKGGNGYVHQMEENSHRLLCWLTSHAFNTVMLLLWRVRPVFWVVWRHLKEQARPFQKHRNCVPLKFWSPLLWKLKSWWTNQLFLGC